MDKFQILLFFYFDSLDYQSIIVCQEYPIPFTYSKFQFMIKIY